MQKVARPPLECNRQACRFRRAASDRVRRFWRVIDRGVRWRAMGRGARFCRALIRLNFLLLLNEACTHPPPGRYAIDDIGIEGAHAVSASDIEERIATAASPRFLGLFRGVV